MSVITVLDKSMWAHGRAGRCVKADMVHCRIVTCQCLKHKEVWMAARASVYERELVREIDTRLLLDWRPRHALILTLKGSVRCRNNLSTS